MEEIVNIRTFDGPEAEIELFRASYFLQNQELLDADTAFGLMHTRPQLWGAVLSAPKGFLPSAPDIDDTSWLQNFRYEPVDLSNLHGSKISRIEPDGTETEISWEEYDRIVFAGQVKEAKELVESHMSRFQLAARKLLRLKFPAERAIQS